MNSRRFDRCSQPDFLRQIGRAKLGLWLSPFAAELAAHGVVLAAAAQADADFFPALAALARRAEELSEPLQMMLLAIEVTNEVLPDERPSAPWPKVVTELRLRVRAKEPVTIVPAGAQGGLMDYGMNGLMDKGINGFLDCWVEGVAGPSELAPAAEPGVNATGAGVSNLLVSPASGGCGRLRWEHGFDDVWLGETHYDLRTRNSARFCIQYLVASQAFDKSTARHLENEIDPFVRIKTRLPTLPRGATSNLRIQRYFNDPVKKYQQLRKELIRAEGRTGRFYLQVN